MGRQEGQASNSSFCQIECFCEIWEAITSDIFSCFHIAKDVLDFSFSLGYISGPGFPLMKLGQHAIPVSLDHQQLPFTQPTKFQVNCTEYALNNLD